MKITKKVIYILLMAIVFLIIKSKISHAVVITPEYFTGTDGLQTIIQQRDKAVGDLIYTGDDELHSSSNAILYCTQQQRKNAEEQKYQVVHYLEINGDQAKYCNVRDKTDYTQTPTPDIIELRNSGISGDYRTALLATVMANYSDSRGYNDSGTGIYNNISKTQRALWYFLFQNNSWICSNFGSWYMNEKENANAIYGEPLYNECLNLVNSGKGYSGTVRLWWLAPIEKQDSQSLMIVEVGEAEESEEPTEVGTLTIDKRDVDTGSKLSKVSFIVQCAETSVKPIETEGEETFDYTGKYVNNSNGTDWTESEDEAMKFSTGSSSYKSIQIQGLPPGIYIIKEVENENEGYESNIGLTWEVEITSGGKATVDAKNKEIDEGSGNVSISGMVWEDVFTGKNNSHNNRFGSEDNTLEGIKVLWRSSSGTLLAQTVTDENGYWEMKQNVQIYNHTYHTGSMYNTLNNSYIEFEYNGLKYTTIATSRTGSNTSKATENQTSRSALDNGFKAVTRDIVKDIGVSIGYDSGGNKSEAKLLNDQLDLGESVIDYSSGKTCVTANTKLTGINGLLSSYAATESSTYCVRHTYEYYTTTNSKGETVRRKRTIHHYGERVDKWTITDINLGLMRREQPDIALTSDIEKVRVVMKGQEYTYKYNNRGIQNNEELFNYTVKFGSKYTTQKYTRPVNPADIAYVKANGTDELNVYVTYNIIASNQSTTLPVTVKDIVNYFDSKYDIYTGVGSETSSGWTYSDTSGSYKVAHCTFLDGVKINPGTKSSLVKIEFEINQQTIKGLLNNQATMKNVSEIYSYSTWYGSSTKCAEDKTASSHGKTGKQYAGIDVDSRPGSATPGSVGTYEDDTDQAPSFVLCKDSNYKTISGTVFEDTDKNESDEERLGDGEKSNKENNKVDNVRVELIKVNDDGSTETAQMYSASDPNNPKPAITWTQNGEYKFGSESEYGIVVDNYIIKYTYGNDTTATVNNNPDADIVLKNGAVKINGNEINARNYKSTIITSEPVESIMKRNIDNPSTITAEDLEWHLNVKDNASIAVDNIRDLKWYFKDTKYQNNRSVLVEIGKNDTDDRLDITPLMNSNFNTPVNVSAYSLPFKIQIEYTQSQESKVGTDGGSFEKNWGRFDFGIIERAREDIVVDKTIDRIRISLANGQVLTEGDPYSGTLNYVRALGNTEIFDRNRFKDSVAREKKVFMEMDAELIQGATLEILYKITVSNNSEIDYEYEPELGGNEKYYYYGEINSPKIKPSVEYLVDYVDPDLTCEVGDGTQNVNWQKVSAEDLRDNSDGYMEITEEVYNRIKRDEGNYLIFVTNKFKNIAAGERHSETLYVSKLLANQADEHVYENHAEIIQLNGKIARTIDSTKDGEQIKKTYIPGNYVPSLNERKLQDKFTNPATERLHEQDDDSITLTITPPTGLPDNIIIYIISGTIGLVIIGMGIYIIRRKII